MIKMREELYPKLILILLSKASWYKLLVKSAVFENWSKLFYFFCIPKRCRDRAQGSFIEEKLSLDNSKQDYRYYKSLLHR